jgi:hypothetical protein
MTNLFRSPARLMPSNSGHGAAQACITDMRMREVVEPSPITCFMPMLSLHAPRRHHKCQNVVLHVSLAFEGFFVQVGGILAMRDFGLLESGFEDKEDKARCLHYLNLIFINCQK